MLFFRNLIRKNRFFAAKNSYEIASCTALQFKKVKVKISGCSNFLRVGSNCRLQNCEIRIKGKNNVSNGMDSSSPNRHRCAKMVSRLQTI